MDVSSQLFVEDILPEELAAIEKRMRSRVFSKASFLGRGQRLRNVVSADAAILKELGVTYKQIGGSLKYIVHSSYQGIGTILPGKNAFPRVPLRVSLIYSPGHQECPFFYATESTKRGVRAYTCGKGQSNFIVENMRTHERIFFPELMSHLVRDHHFFEGDTPYRLDPERAVRVLNLV